MSDESDWFLPKRYGISASWPIRWQGWALVGGYLVVLAAAGFIIPYSRIGYASIVIIMTASFMIVASRTTRGGWRWRWGDEE